MVHVHKIYPKFIIFMFFYELCFQNYVIHNFSVGMLVKVVYVIGAAEAYVGVSVWARNDQYDLKIGPRGTHFYKKAVMKRCCDFPD